MDHNYQGGTFVSLNQGLDKPIPIGMDDIPIGFFISQAYVLRQAVDATSLFKNENLTMGTEDNHLKKYVSDYYIARVPGTFASIIA